MTVTLVHALSPLKEVFKPDSYDQFVRRWEKKKLSQEEIESVRDALHDYAFIFKRPQMVLALGRAHYAYAVFAESKQNAQVTHDPVLLHMIRTGVGSNIWLAAVNYAYREFITRVNAFNKSGKMVFKLFMASLSVLHNEASEAAQEAAPFRDEHDMNGEDDAVDTAQILDPSTMTLEEQVQKFNLNPDTYF